MLKPPVPGSSGVSLSAFAEPLHPIVRLISNPRYRRCLLAVDSRQSAGRRCVRHAAPRGWPVMRGRPAMLKSARSSWAGRTDS
ncbi:hypothetical protein B7486_09470 [cyanobacterium TDX16]|nr:hypothetical protein B7486_09470 [cyanobacterium TDX16]